MKKGNPEHVESLETACGKTVSTVQGSTQIKLAEDMSAACTKAGKPPIRSCGTRNLPMRGCRCKPAGSPPFSATRR